MCEEQDCVQFTVNRQSAGFMSLNKLGDKYKAVFSTIVAATFNFLIESLMENQHS